MTAALDTTRARPTTRTNDNAIANWLFVVAGLVFAMVVLGGVTRLTESGLSIVDWEPFVGTIPPLSEADWHALFDRYKQYPEYQKVNFGMTLEGFKEIFWLEYFHRLLGRAIGVVFLVPFLYFLVRGRIRKSLAPKLAFIFVLGGLQGVLGWYMVKSGLVDRPDVSPYKLAAHLGLAAIIYLAMIWVALGLRARRPLAAPMARHQHRVVFGALALLVIAFITLLAGAFVAGTDAGFAYNTFPDMEGQLVPADLFIYQPAWRNFFESVPLVQLNHRLLGYLTVLGALLLFIASGAWRRQSRLSLEARRVLLLVAGVALAQFALGLSTLLLVVPIPLAAGHQAGAMLLLTVLLWAVHALRLVPHGYAGEGATRAA